MRVLFITFFFPPYRTVGAVRTGQTARQLLALGHDVRVVSAGRQPLQSTLTLEVPAERVTYTNWLGRRLVTWTAGSGPHARARRGSGPMSLSRARPLLGALRRHAIYVPDKQMGWLPYAVAAARCLVADERPDIIYASSMPMTSLLVAALVSKATGVPWVGELRDLWSDDNYRELGRWQRWVDRCLEGWVLSSAAGLVTVSEPLADVLRKRYGPVEVVYNGFDERPHHDRSPSDPRVLSIVYTGYLYRGKRDPTPLFRAIRELGEEGRAIEVRFYGPDGRLAMELARAEGVQDHVRVMGEVSYEESLTAQSAADALLLLLWNRPGEEGVVTGKLFEYMGAGRPILAVGASHGVAVDLIETRSLGFVSSQPDRIAEQLAAWVEEKKRVGQVGGTSVVQVNEFDRRTQTRRLESFLRVVLRSQKGKGSRAGAAS